jgi:hypothetical protein
VKFLKQKYLISFFILDWGHPCFEVEKLHDSWHFLVLNSEKFPPHGRGEGMSCALVYSTFLSFLENLDIEEFNRFWDIVHLGMINVFSFS